MIISALRAKLRTRGPIGFATDALELAAACYLIAAWQAVAGTSILVGGVVAAPFWAWDILTRPRAGERPHRCDADCGADRTVCGGGQEFTHAFIGCQGGCPPMCRLAGKCHWALGDSGGVHLCVRSRDEHGVSP